MKIHELFVDDITRRIEGVIKVSEVKYLVDEMREFVITEEIGKILRELFEKYTAPKQGNPGVWLSGFFGTGKSHLLKILSLVLSNREVDGVKLGNAFLEKLKDDFDIEGLVMKVVREPAQTILFNIDSIADQKHRTGEANIFMPFKKMFDRALGFSDDPAIAKLERDLIHIGKLDAFKEAFKKATGKEWESSRERLLTMSKGLDTAFAEVTGDTTITDVRKKYQEETPLSVESFINDIRDYLDTKPAGFRLVFLVDEVGQYISRDPRTMLNLQTLVEDFAVAFRGRVWVMVTAQEEVTEMVKTMNAAQKSDFSKILGRFEVKPKLTSQNAQEVIKRRLLKKKPEAQTSLDYLFEQQGEVIKTKFTFPDDTSYNKQVPNTETFTGFYPVLPYQVELYQQCLISLSAHGAFVGNYASLGARSMLGVFQSALMSVKDAERGSFVPFDLFFEGTRALLKAQPYHTISVLEGNHENPFNLRLLKVLYLLKYLNNFPVTVKNLAVLMTEESDGNREELEKKIRTSLDYMVRYSWVQEVNGIYEYQTDIQQDVINGIKAVPLNPGELRNFIASTVFTDLLTKSNNLKLKHNRTGLNFPYSKKIDRHDHGSPIGEVKLHLITGIEDNYPTDTELLSLSMTPNELLIVIASDKKLIEDVALHLRTIRYAQLNSTGQLSEEKAAVIQAKTRENGIRRKSIESLIEILLRDAKFLFNGREITSQSSDFFTRLNEAAQQLIDGSYIYLNKLTKVPVKADIFNLLRDHTSEQFIAEMGAFNDVENELFMQISNKVESGVRVDLNSLIEHFKKIPYGYIDNLIIPHALTSLFVHGKVTIYYNVTEMSALDLSKKIDNSREYGSIIVKTVEEIPNDLVQTARMFAFNWFGKPLNATDNKLVFQEMKDELHSEVHDLKNLVLRANEYPFLYKVNPVLERFERVVNFDMRKFFDYISEFGPALIEEKDIIERIRNFMKGGQKDLYDRVSSFLKDHRTDLEHLESEYKDMLVDYLKSDEPYLNTQFNKLTNALDDLGILLSKKMNDLKLEMCAVVASMRENLQSFDGYSGVPEEDRYKITQILDRHNSRVNTSSSITSLQLFWENFELNLRTEIVQKIQDLQPKVVAPPPTTVDAGEPNIAPPPQPTPPAVKIVQMRMIKIDYNKQLISSRGQVEEYIESLKRKMNEEIDKGNQIIL